MKESNEVVAWYDFNSDSPSGKDLSVDLSINNANQKNSLLNTMEINV